MAGLIAIGVGCRKSCASEAIVAIVRRALADCGQAEWSALSLPPCGGGRGWRPSDLTAAGREGVSRLFSVADKSGEPGLRTAAEALGFELVFLPREALAAAAPRILTRSAATQRRFALDSVAEAAALAGAGPNARLLAPRLAQNGATCAIAIGPGVSL